MNKIVGRQKELDTIDAALAELAAGQGSTLFVSGEPGIGKSTLARILGERARARGFSVYRGYCWESEGAPAYWPWTQVMRLLVSDANVPDRLTASLGQLLPESSGDALDTELQPEQARFQLLEAVRGLLDRIARNSPVVIALDDLHSADADSLYLLQYLAKHAPGMPLLLAGTYRELEARQSAATESLWRAGRDATTLRLARLDQAAVAEYLADAGRVDHETVRSMLETTGGNPLFLTELVTLLDRRQSDQLPRTIQQVIEQQISLLPELTATILGQASVFGREFEIAVLAFLRDQDESTTERQVEAAVTAGLVQLTKPGRYRYSHVLYRDVLYRGLGATTREALHVRSADYLKTLIDAGAKDRWSIYAVHLEAAGPDYRSEAIAAWEKAAERAHVRLAYEEAAQCLQNAIAIFGQGPKFDPLRRCELQLQSALALFLAGNTKSGQAQCRDVFATARTLQDSVLMSEAALTYGTALVVGHIDKELISMLRECLDTLSASNDACRARVQARLAAALQPALDPSVPVKMAHEAIALARSIDDDRVLFSVLRSAMSALMDFAAAPERIPLNREFGVLAEKHGNVAEQFRSYLRLMIDAVEIANRQLFDESIDAAEQIAKRIDLPHFLWRTASMRATQAIAEGRYESALSFIDEAQAHADHAGDLESLITLPIQRFAIAIEWDDLRSPTLADIDAQLRHAYANGMAEAEFFINPLIAVYSGSSDLTVARDMLRNKAFLDRAFGGGDRATISTIGEFAAGSGDVATAQRAYDQILPRAAECCSLGLMGGGIFRPIALSLGIIARQLGRLDLAKQHFETALGLLVNMRARPLQAHVHAELAEIETAMGNHGAAEPHRCAAEDLAQLLHLRGVTGIQAVPDTVAAAPSDGQFEMRLDGDIRIVSYAGMSTSLKDSRGLELLARLISRPDEELHVLDLVGSMADVAGGDSGPQLDEQAHAQYKRRIRTLQDELEEAESLADLGRVDALRGELEFITRELSRAFGLGARPRRSGSDAERARINVRRRLKNAIDRIAEQLPDAGRYLDNTIKTGSYCKYSPM